MKFFRYLKDCFREMKRVSWPSRKEVVHSTRVVVISTIIVAVILGLVDWLLLRGALLVFGS